VFHFTGVGGALKHHVLEEVGEAAASAGFEAETDLIVDADGDDGGATVGRCDHSQTIGESGVFDGDVQLLRRLIQMAPPFVLSVRISSCF
jgi:hypothetical protein